MNFPRLLRSFVNFLPKPGAPASLPAEPLGARTALPARIPSPSGKGIKGEGERSTSRTGSLPVLVAQRYEALSLSMNRVVPRASRPFVSIRTGGTPVPLPPRSDRTTVQGFKARVHRRMFTPALSRWERENRGSRQPGLPSPVVAVFAALVMSSWTAGAEEPKPLFVEGYAGRVSYAPGEQLTLHVSTSAKESAVEITRLSAKRETVWSSPSVEGREHPVPEDASSHGCRWPAAVTMKIPETWRSGYYHVTLRARDGGGKYIQRNTRTAEGGCYFVLRPGTPGKETKILLQLSTHTYNAYNNWGGFSLYAYHGRGGNQGHRVSYQRPPTTLFPNWEQPFVEWAERSGIVLDYAANGDLEFHPEMLKAYRLVLSVGHDEYWSAPMRDNLEKFIADGGNVAFFSGNTCCWQVRSEDNGQALTCWKQNFLWDPVYGTRAGYGTLSTLWSHHLVNRPENQLTGVGFLWGGYHKSHGQLMDASGALTVHRPEHWLFAGTGLKRGDEFGGKDTIVGYECDGCELEWKDGLPFPTHRDGTPRTFEVLATAPAQWHPDDCRWYDQWENSRKGNAVLGVYTRGGTVFTCGSTDWAHGLRGNDPIVERVTRNVIERLGK